jgi:hypothetical protein
MQDLLKKWEIEAVSIPKMTYENPPMRKVVIYLTPNFQVFKLEQPADLNPAEFTTIYTSHGDYTIKATLKEADDLVQTVMEDVHTNKLINGEPD